LIHIEKQLAFDVSCFFMEQNRYKAMKTDIDFLLFLRFSFQKRYNTT